MKSRFASTVGRLISRGHLRNSAITHRNHLQFCRFGTAALVQETDVSAHDIGNINSSFSLQVAKKFLSSEISLHKNSVCSPLSINVMLSMLAVGSEGRTRQQILRLLECRSVEEFNDATASRIPHVTRPSDVGDDPMIGFCNGVWVDSRFPLKASYEEIVGDILKAKVVSMDFKQPDHVVKDVNAWASDKTQGSIKDVVVQGSIRADMTMILANALYFQGTWAQTFDASNTQDGRFHLLNGDNVRIPFVRKSNAYYEYGAFKDFKVLKMPYEAGDARRFSMYVFLPDEKNGLPKLMEEIKVNSEMFEEQMKLNVVEVRRLMVPKFDMECTFGASDTLKQLGLTLPFRFPGELTGIVDPPEGQLLYVQDMLQRCRVENNERVTEAAAVTSNNMSFGCGGSSTPTVDFIADRPFLYMIREDISGAIFFIGALLKQSQLGNPRVKHSQRGHGFSNAHQLQNFDDYFYFY